MTSPESSRLDRLEALAETIQLERFPFCIPLQDLPIVQTLRSSRTSIAPTRLLATQDELVMRFQVSRSGIQGVCPMF